MPEIKSKPGLRNYYYSLPEEVKNYFGHLPSISRDYPLDVCLTYVFSRVELAHNMTIYCGAVKLHKADSGLARTAVDNFHMTRPGFRSKFETVFGVPIPADLQELVGKAESIRDRVLHGKTTSPGDRRQAVGNVLEYAVGLNDFVDGCAGFKPFNDLRGFKGAATSLDKSTTRWMLRGMGFNV